MKAFLLCILLLCSSFTALSMTIDKFLFRHRDDLRLFLDWCHKYSDVFEIQKQKYMVELNSEEDIVVKALQTYKAQKISNLLYASKYLRNVLVKGDNDYVISDQLERNAETLAVFMSTMPYVLDDLQKSIKEWVNDEHMLRTSLRVLDEKPLKWFKDHGFDESSLNDVTMQVLQEEIGKLCGDRKPFDSMLSFFGTLHTFIYSADLGSRLAWLYTVGSNPKALYSLENYLRREGSTVQPKIITGILEYLRKLGDKEGSLSRLFGSSRDGGLYPFIMPMLGKASFFDGRGEQYMNILIDICSNLPIELHRFRNTFESIKDNCNPTYYWEYGFLFNREKLDSCSISRHMQVIISEQMLITNLASAVLEAIRCKECLMGYVHGNRLTLPKSLIMSGMLAMGITAV